MFETGGVAQSEKTVTINRPIEKLGALLNEKCKTGGYRDDCIPDCGIYVYAATNGLLSGIGAKMVVQLTKVDDNSTTVNIKGSGLNGSVTSNANIETYILELIKYLNSSEIPAQKPAVKPSNTHDGTPQPAKKGGHDFLWVMLALAVTIAGVVIYIKYFYN